LLNPNDECHNLTINREGLRMRVVTLEEHLTVPSVVAKIDKAAIARRGFKGGRRLGAGRQNPMELLPETGEKRLKSMDDAGITQQVLSNSGPGPDLMPGQTGIDLAREVNDTIAGVIAKNPKRFAGFAALPMASPDAAAAEFKRAVKDLKLCGAMVHGSSVDMPIYIHPSIPTPNVFEAYYSGLPEGADRVVSTAGWGWHSEVAIQIVRMTMAGTFDKHPKLKMIIGHMGEMLPVMLARLDDISAADCDHLKRKPAATIIEQVWITTSGVFTQPPFIAALQTFGIDRILFSVDYPFARDAQGRKFLDEVALAPADMAKLAHGNADKLLKLSS
jgi:predicted TIM-barrel fold metal-dependent hydrolase